VPILCLALTSCGEDYDFVADHAGAAEQHRVQTDDGAWTFLQRYACGGCPPVVLVHGISSNHHFWDLEPDRSLALHLFEAGWDVWNMDLRGHGPARHDPEGRRQKPGWTIDDYGNHDLPAAFAHVLEATGAASLAYVGHSMGGMVLAVYLANHDQPPLSAAVAVCSPLDFRDPDPVTKAAFEGALIGRVPRFLPSPTGGRLLARLDERTPLALDEMLYNPANMTEGARRTMLRRIVSPLSRGEVAQFGKIGGDGEFRSADGERIYRHELGEVTVPMLFIAGRADRVAAPDRVRSYYEAVGSPDKELVVDSVANGFHGDYGHLDIGLGDDAAVDVFPLVVDWLHAHP